MSLRPNDPFAKRLLSTPVTTHNLLLKVTVPKRTGRKRKRGSSGPFLHEHELQDSDSDGKASAGTSNHTYLEVSDIYRSLQDNASRYKVAFAGVVDETHRFRGEHSITYYLCTATNFAAMPDLQYAASHNDVMVTLRDHILPARCESM